MVFGDTRFSDRAPATVNALNVEPGSYVNPVAVFRRASGEALDGLLGSKVGQSAMARTSELRGSMTIAVALFGWYVWARLARTSSVRAWIPASSVSLRSCPCCAPLTVFR